MIAHLQWTGQARRSRDWSPALRFVVAISLIVVSAAFALGSFRYGLAVSALGLGGLTVAWAILSPRTFVWALFATLMIVEPSAFDLTGPLSSALYRFPDRINQALHFTIAPIEVLALITLVSLLVRTNEGRAARWRRVPVLALAIPVFMMVGLAYGYLKGANLSFAYQEMRGLIWMVVAFALVIEVVDHPPKATTTILTRITTVAAAVLIARYFLFTRNGLSTVPIEFAYAHESVLFLAGGVALSASLWMERVRGRGRWLLLMHMVLLLAAIVVTGRRAGTLVLIAMAAPMFVMMLVRRPLAVGALGLVFGVCFAGYTAAYWNHEYGAIAQPARAIRSQFDPTVRDASSDNYRLIERASVLDTLRSNPVFGVGFGKEFTTTTPLPVLTDFWPLQYFTPHENVLWLWLKMGAVGICTFLGVWLIACGRAVRAIVVTPRNAPLAIAALPLLGLFTAYLFFATVDITFSQTRAAAPLGAALALAFMQFPAWTGAAARRQERI